MSSNKPPLLLIVGMHRSGTSLLGGILNALGVALPGNTIPGDIHNPDGYYEWDEIVNLQERLLIDLQRWWPSAEGTLKLPVGWLDHPATLRAYSQLKELVETAVNRQQGLWAIKDPRTSRLLPLWLKLCRDLGIPLRLLLSVRDPVEVVTSLVRRDGPIVGMDINRAQQLWWRHNVDVLDIAKASDLPLLVVDFACWFNSPETQIDVLERAFPELCPSPSQRKKALSLIKPQHRRSFTSQQKPRLKSGIRRLHRRLLRKHLLYRWPLSFPSYGIANTPVYSLTVNSEDPSAWSDWIFEHRSFPAPRLTQNIHLSTNCLFNVCGSTWLELRPHLLMQVLPIPYLGTCFVDFANSIPHQLALRFPEGQESSSVELVHRLALNLELPSTNRASHWLDHLRGHQLILDPEPSRVLLLRALGLPAWWIDPHADSNGWLNLPQAVDTRQWSARLGLMPPPEGQLLMLGPAGACFERALAHEMTLPPEDGGDVGKPDIAYFPGWPELVIDDPASGLLRAGWLQSAAQQSARLVFPELDHSPADLDLLKLQAPYLVHPIDAPPADLRAHHSGKPLMALSEDRPMPPLEILRKWEAADIAQRPPLVSVVVSHYNYANRISKALQSITNQTQQRLELIVVDDASTDDGTVVMERWFDNCLCFDDHPFVRVLLLRHSQNAGLAVARNTAFCHSQAPWCFVLDADNALYPDAVAGCMALVDSSDSHLAVVHPLLAVEAEPGRLDEQRTLVSSASWQRERLLSGNVVDAMALVRRSAWENVGGYTHIEGGWEDYDFWCKLVEAGYHGLQCPRILAVYRSHAESMSNRLTNRSWHALSRALQKRHPWLRLRLAQLEES